MPESKWNYTHGDTGTEPSSPQDAQSDTPADSKFYDWFITTTIEKINGIVDDISDILDGTLQVGDSDQLDGYHESAFVKVDDTIDNADMVDGFHATELRSAQGTSIPAFELADGEYIAVMALPNVPANRDIVIPKVILSADEGSATPSGLDVVIRNVTDGTNVTTYSAGWSDPGDSFAIGGKTVLIAVDNGHFTNDSAGQLDTVTAQIDYRMEDTS